MQRELGQSVRLILDYMMLHMKPEKCDIILGLGCHDVRVGQRAAQLMLDGYARILVFTGGFGKVTQRLNTRTEAEIFRDAAVKMGVPENQILLEKRAVNIGENISLTAELLESEGIKADTLLIVTKPYYERRAFATFTKQWPVKSAKFIISSPEIAFDEQAAADTSWDFFINLMVGDLQRIKEYPKRGFQIEQEIPKEVWHAYENLIAAGYDKCLLNRSV